MFLVETSKEIGEQDIPFCVALERVESKDLIFLCGRSFV